MKDSLAIIRDRYQLTIPEEIRKNLNWLKTQKVVRWVLVGEDKVLVEPYQESAVSWPEIWENLKKVKNWGAKSNLADFVVADRASH